MIFLGILLALLVGTIITKGSLLTVLIILGVGALAKLYKMVN